MVLISFNVNVLDEPALFNSPFKLFKSLLGLWLNSITFPILLCICFSCLFASLNTAKYVSVMMVHGIQNETLDENIT